MNPGWFQRQSESVAEEVKQWPAWMRRAAGLEEDVSDTWPTPIPVTERLPEPDPEHPHQSLNALCFADGEWVFGWYDFKAGKWWVEYGEATHWLPIPPAP